MESADDTTATFINAYTDITQTRLKVRTRTNVLEGDPGTTGTGMDEQYTDMDIENADYLVAGIWMTVDNEDLRNSQIQAFAYGSQPIPASFNFCSGLDGSTTPASSTSGTTTTTRICAETTGLNSIAGANEFVDEGKSTRVCHPTS